MHRLPSSPDEQTKSLRIFLLVIGVAADTLIILESGFLFNAYLYLNMKIEFRDNKLLQHSLDQARKRLKSASVEIGLPASAPARSRWLLALHERGAPGAHIPPRPVVAPALAQESTRAAMAEGLLAACEAAAQGDPGGIASGFAQAGQAGADGIRAYIDAGIEPGNAPLTIHGGWIRNFSSGKPVRVEGKGFDKPLYDTGGLYESFDYEVKTGGES